MEKKNLIISLIKDSLINTRLVHGLNMLGLNAGDYHVYLTENIFNLIDIKGNRDQLFEEYLKMCEEVSKVEFFKYPKLLNSLAYGIYEELKIRSNYFE